MNGKKLSVLLVSSLVIVAVASVVFTPKEASAATVTFNDSLTWEVGNTNNGYDEYALEIEAGQSVQFTLLCNGVDFNPLIQIYQNSSLLASDDDSYPAGAQNPCSASAQLDFTATVAGGYIVRVTTADYVSGTDVGNGTGSYTLTANGNFLSFGPTANNVPHLGLVLIGLGQSQPAAVAPGSSQVLVASNGADIILPSDADSSGYDTYIVTGAASVDGEIWISIWLGGTAYGWVPLEDVTPVTLLDLPAFPTKKSGSAATATRVTPVASPSVTVSPSATAPTQTPAATATQ